MLLFLWLLVMFYYCIHWSCIENSQIHYSFTEPDLSVKISQVKVGHTDQLPLVVSFEGLGWELQHSLFYVLFK